MRSDTKWALIGFASFIAFFLLLTGWARADLPWPIDLILAAGFFVGCYSLFVDRSA